MTSGWIVGRRQATRLPRKVEVSCSSGGNGGGSYNGVGSQFWRKGKDCV